MKQKRTVKSLLSNEYKLGEKVFTVLLLTLSVMLCLWAATLMTTSVWAAEEENPSNSNNIYSWYDDKVEVLYKMEFSNPENLYDENGEPVDNFYMEDNILYVSPNMIRVKNSGNTWNHSFLWWEWNDVKSYNVTMLAWYKNIVENNGDNASLLWWSGNKVAWNSSQVPVIAWWKGNQILDNNKWNVILWWDKNKIQHSADSIILWWENNEITANYVVIWWKKVKISGEHYIFAFSNENSQFEPQTEKTFYLNLTNWVWINADSEKTGMAVWGAVWFWSVGWETCNSNNIWVEWILNLGGYGCLVWCTKKSSDSEKWELLDRWENCEKGCATSSKCMNFTEWNSNENQNYIGYCSQEIPEWAIKCTSWEWESYTNVVFQTLRVDSQNDCGKVGDNKCAYYCEWGDCDLPNNEPDPVTPPEEPSNTFKCIWEAPSEANHRVAKEGSQDSLTQDIEWHRAKNDSDVKCAYVCNPAYHREWDKCEPNTREVECKQEWAPENSKYILKTEIQWSSDGNWPEIPNCEWNCVDGFVEINWVCREPVATLLPWPQFNSAVAGIIDDSDITFVTHIDQSDKIPNGVKTWMISTEDSVFPVYAWYDNWTLYYYTEAKEVYFNQNSSAMFAWFENLVDVDMGGRDTSKVTNMEAMFSGCSNLGNLDVSKWNTSNVANMKNLFLNCNSLSELDVSKWNTSNVTNMYGMFDYCRNLKELDVSNWDTSSVTNMGYLFASCINLKRLDVSNWDTSKVTNMRFLFWWHKGDIMSLEYLDVSNWDVSNVKDMAVMFQNCVSLKELDVGEWNTRSLENMDHMFFGCSRLENLDVSKWNTANVTIMSDVFYDCVSLTWLDVSNWDTSKVTDMKFLFCWGGTDMIMKLKKLDVSKWDTSNVKDMQSMFQNCDNLIELDLSNWATNKVANMSYMFSKCTNLKTVFVGEWFVTTKVTTKASENMFDSNESLIWWNWTVYNPSYKDKTYARIDGKDGKPWYFTSKE